MKCVEIYEWAVYGYLTNGFLVEMIQFLCLHLKCVHSSSAAKRNGNRQAGELLWKHLLSSSLVWYNASEIPLETTQRVGPLRRRGEADEHAFLIRKVENQSIIITLFAFYQYVPITHHSLMFKQIELSSSKVSIDRRSSR